jgi:hypothetical protein
MMKYVMHCRHRLVALLTASRLYQTRYSNYSNYLHLSVTSKVVLLHTAPVHMRQSAYRFSKLLHFETVSPCAASM